MWGGEQLKEVLKVQDQMDAADFAIVDAINNCESVGDMLDYDVLARLSGLDAQQMKSDFVEICDKRRFIVPMIYINFMKLGLTMKAFLVRLFQNVPSYRKAQIADELSDIPEFNNVWEFTDSFYDMMLTAYNGITDIDELRRKLDGYGEIEEIKEADMTRQFRRWVARLDDQNGFWEECVFTDDFLQDRTVGNDVKCCFGKEGK